MVIGLVLANIFQPGSGLSISTEGLKAKEVAPPTLIDVFLNIVPINPIEALSKGNMLQIIFFALLFGFGSASSATRASRCSTSSTARPTS